MSHPLVEILDRIEAEYMAAEGDTLTLFAEYDAKVLAAFEARDLAVAKAVMAVVRQAIESIDLDFDDIRCVAFQDLIEIIKGVK